MKTGSRPTCRIARTGEFTPPGRTFSARRYSSADRSKLGMLGLPGGVLLGEIPEADLLVLGRGVESGAVVGAHPALLGDRLEDRVALLLGAAVGHGEDAVGPVLIGRPLIAVGDAAKGRHMASGLHDLRLGNLPDAH